LCKYFSADFQSDLMPEYANLLGSLQGKGASEWSSQFKDWNFMSLREDIVRD